MPGWSERNPGPASPAYRFAHAGYSPARDRGPGRSRQVGALDPVGAEDVRAQEIRRPVHIARLDQIENAEMLAALQRQAAAVDRDFVFDEAAKPVHAPDRVDEEVVVGAGHQHFMKFAVGAEQAVT